MSKYQREFDVRVQFDGEEIVARCKAATFVQAERLRSAEGDKARVAALVAALRDSVVSFTGVHDSAGSPVALEEFLSSGYFLSAVLELGTSWVNRSLPQPEASAVVG